MPPPSFTLHHQSATINSNSKSPNMAFPRFVLTLTVALTLVGIMPVYSQINTPCSSSMLNSFTPCLNFVTNSTANGASTPTSDCCSSLRSITSGGTDCLCLIVTGSVPFQLPINRTLAISLPRACRMPGVPLQCKAAASPVPAATLSPQSAPSATPQGSMSPESEAPTLAPESETTPVLTPESPGIDSGAPTTNPGSRPVLNPSAAAPTYACSPFILLAVLGAMSIKMCEFF